MSSLSFLVPPLWAVVDFRSHVNPEMSIAGFTAQVVRAAPSENRPMARRVLDDSVVPQLEGLRQQGAAYVLMPVTLLVVHPVVTVTPWRLPEDVDPTAVLYEVVGDDPDVEPVEFEGMVGLRRESSVEATAALAAATRTWAGFHDAPLTRMTQAEYDALLPSAARDDLSLRSHRVHYSLGVFDVPSSWMEIQLTVDHPTTAEADSIVAETVDLFDEIVSTFRWSS